jgi:hypothetical protein
MDDAPWFPVYVPVPPDCLDEVLQLLMQHRESRSAVGRWGSAGAPHASDPLDWDDSSLESLMWGSPTGSSMSQPGGMPGLQAHVLHFFAECAGEDVTAEELEQYLLTEAPAGRFSRDNPGRALGAVMRSLKKRCAYYNDRGLPFWARRTELGTLYRLPVEHKDVILRVWEEPDFQENMWSLE